MPLAIESISSCARSLGLSAADLRRRGMNSRNCRRTSIGDCCRRCRYRDCILAARQHVGQECVVRIDISRFYGSITSGRVYRLFVDQGCSPDVARLLTRLTTREGRVPQLDRLLEELQGAGLQCTRYIDDVQVSGPRLMVVDNIAKVIMARHASGLKVNRGKTEIMSAEARQLAMNLVVNSMVSLPKNGNGGLTRKSLRDGVRRAARYGVTEKERRSLEGKLQYMRRLHRKQADKLLKRLVSAPTSSR